MLNTLCWVEVGSLVWWGWSLKLGCHLFRNPRDAGPGRRRRLLSGGAKPNVMLLGYFSFLLKRLDITKPFVD